jgi:lipopolysaccharide/colanic/teichoic acid biosynthesis glycosyltransferase
MKRLFDIFFSAVGLIVLLPFFAVVAVIIKIESRGPIFFLQKRIGKNLKPFNLYKFRTMVTDVENRGVMITPDDDPRITAVGRFLRKTKIDELPQLWNVLKGDMSFVGPRPEVEKYVNKYREEYEKILKLRPGITGLGSLAYSDEGSVLKDKKDAEEYYIQVLLPEKIDFAMEYMKKASLLYDLKLILFTIFKLLYPHDSIVKAINIRLSKQ